MQIARAVLTAIVVIWIAAPLMAQTITTSDLSFAIPDYGGISVTTAGSSNGTSAGYATVQPDSGKTTPAGIAVVAYRTNNTLLGEFSMPAVPSLQNGRIYAEIGGAISTGIVFANTNNQTAVISFKFTDANGNDYGTNSYNLAANSQLAAFLTQVPFNSATSRALLRFLPTFQLPPSGFACLRMNVETSFSVLCRCWTLRLHLAPHPPFWRILPMAPGGQLRPFL
jgi:hypothetical protein